MHKKRLALLLAVCLALAVEMWLRTTAGELQTADLSDRILYTTGEQLITYRNGKKEIYKPEIGKDVRIQSIKGVSPRGLVLSTSDFGRHEYVIAGGQGTHRIAHLPVSDYEIYSGGYFYSAASGDTVVVKQIDPGDTTTATYRLRLPHRAGDEPTTMDVYANREAVLTIHRPKHRDASLIYCDLPSRKCRVIGSGHTPKFSHSGRYIAYCTDRLGVVKIYDVKNQSTREVRVWRPRSILNLGPAFFCASPCNTYGVDWSQDDKWILCGMMYAHIRGKVHAARVSPESPGWRVLITGPGSGDWYPLHEPVSRERRE